ncbi:Thioredoxin [Grifola frondosa]|uniref:Thioredoxin n=1 Tax=Grifola frondosa TaxID=5627 RepID=A0A1C7M000_GRIFR|nr:Thioredoxin [Grifola frondosa]
MTVTAITSLSQFQEIIAQDRPCIIDFWATWCGPCRIISPIFEKLSAQFGENVDFYKVDVDTQSEISEAVGIRAMPTFVAFKGKEKIGEVVGANPPQLENLIITTASK